MVVETDLEARIASLESSLKTFEENDAKRANSLSILVFSGTFDRLMASFTIALGAAAMVSVRRRWSSAARAVL